MPVLAPRLLQLLDVLAATGVQVWLGGGWGVDATRDGWQAGAAPDGTDCRHPADQFTTGTVDGWSVPFLGPLAQVEHHSGYQPRAQDVQERLRLTARYGLPVPEHCPGS